MTPPRMTTRRWMLSVMIVAALTASYVQATQWHLRARYLAALREHLACKRFYEEGRVTLLAYFEKSQRLMEAQIALCSSKTDRTAFVSAHLDRAMTVMEQERNDLIGSRGGFWDLAEAAVYLDDFRTAFHVPRAQARNP